MPNEKAEQEKKVTPKGAVEVNEEQLDDAAGGAILNTALSGEGKTVKIDFCKSSAETDPAISEATFTEKKI